MHVSVHCLTCIMQSFHASIIICGRSHVFQRTSLAALSSCIGIVTPSRLHIPTLIVSASRLHLITLIVSASRLHLFTRIASASRSHLLTFIASCVLVDMRTHTLRAMPHMPAHVNVSVRACSCSHQLKGPSHVGRSRGHIQQLAKLLSHLQQLPKLLSQPPPICSRI